MFVLFFLLIITSPQSVDTSRTGDILSKRPPQSLITHLSGSQVAGCHVTKITAQSFTTHVIIHNLRVLQVAMSGNMIPLVIYICLIDELTLTTGRARLVRVFYTQHRWNECPLSSLCRLHRFIPTGLCVAFKERAHCPATQKECLKRWSAARPETDADSTLSAGAMPLKQTSQWCQVG